MLTKLTAPLIFLCALVPFTARAAILGSGVTSREIRSVAPFSEITVHHALHADITVGDALQVEVSGDDNVVPLVRTEVRGQRLVVEMLPGSAVRPRLALLVRVRVPRLLEVQASGAAYVEAHGRAIADLRVEATGSARVSIAGISGSLIQVTTRGASSVSLRGQSRSLTAAILGASGLQARDAVTEAATITVEGSSRAEICASQSLEVTLTGASLADYYCNPVRVRPRISGASSLVMH